MQCILIGKIRLLGGCQAVWPIVVGTGVAANDNRYILQSLCSSVEGGGGCFCCFIAFHYVVTEW